MYYPLAFAITVQGGDYLCFMGKDMPIHR
jgi:hypothetical protein